ncbi:MAG: LysR family transcriptional regulator, partial [Xanthomonadaceae bacterium]|nr:LysR family transcriptional regulator [Xanthomonadaceae bacterium]
MELRALRCFEMLADELHFARAAERLGLAQSGVSRLLAGLETDLGGKLFNRGKRSQVSLTTTGSLFLPEARAILRQAERGESL